MDKLSFPLTEYKDVNSILAEYFSDYFCRGNFVFGTSTKSWSFSIGVINPSLSSWIQDLLVPPNTMRTVLANCKKTRTVVVSTHENFSIYNTAEKVQGPYFEKEEEKVISLDRISAIDDTPIAKSMMKTQNEAVNMLKQTVYHTGCKQCGSPLDILRDELSGVPASIGCIHPDCKSEQIPLFYAIQNSLLEFVEIDSEPIFSDFDEKKTSEILDSNGSVVILSREAFPKYSKIKHLSWMDVPIDKELSWAIFNADYESMNMIIFIKYINGIN